MPGVVIILLPEKKVVAMDSNNKISREKSNRIILFVDLRDSTNILMNFEKGIYLGDEKNRDTNFTYEKFIRDVHETAYKELYLTH